jgi:hypothetical protein
MQSNPAPGSLIIEHQHIQIFFLSFALPFQNIVGLAAKPTESGLSPVRPSYAGCQGFHQPDRDPIFSFHLPSLCQSGPKSATTAAFITTSISRRPEDLIAFPQRFAR